MKPIDAVELSDAILHLIVQRFGDRQLDIEVADAALKRVGFELRQAMLFSTLKKAP